MHFENSLVITHMHMLERVDAAMISEYIDFQRYLDT